MISVTLLFAFIMKNVLSPWQSLVNTLISVGQGREAAFAAALLGDNTSMEKAWQDTGMLAEAVLHAHVCLLDISFLVDSI